MEGGEKKEKKGGQKGPGGPPKRTPSPRLQKEGGGARCTPATYLCKNFSPASPAFCKASASPLPALALAGLAGWLGGRMRRGPGRPLAARRTSFPSLGF